jgi:hypothetical protein
MYPATDMFIEHAAQFSDQSLAGILDAGCCAPNCLSCPAATGAAEFARCPSPDFWSNWAGSVGCGANQLSDVRWSWLCEVGG